MDINLQELVAATGARLLNEGVHPQETLVHKVSTDTRTLEKGDVFFALKGEKFDAHDYIEEALSKGAKHCVLSRASAAPQKVFKQANILLVEDTLKAYGDLAKFYRQKFRIPVIAVTGSAGKTTVKEILAHLLSAKYKVLKNRGTENNQIGVPKTIFQLEASHEAMVLEIGTSFPGEIERLASIVNPQIGVITHIGHSHLQGLGSIEGVRDEKMKIILGIQRGGKLILNGEDALLKTATSGVHQVIRYGFSSENADWTTEQVWCHEKGSSFYVNGKDLFETQLIGRHNALNASAAIAIASLLDIEMPLLQKALSTFKPVAGRLHMRMMEEILFIDDSYNSNPSSLKAAFETLKSFKTQERKGIVIGDMLELGPESEVLHREMGKQLAGHLFDYVIAVGPLAATLADEAIKTGYSASRAHTAKDSQEAGLLLKKIAKTGDMVLVKGSRGMRMERILECFTTSSTP